MKINTKNLKTIYTNCIDFEKEVILPEQQRFFDEEYRSLITLDTPTLMATKSKYEGVLKKTEMKILRVHFRLSDTNQRVCVETQKEQEILRSKYWATKKIIKRIDHLLSINKYL